MQTEQETLPEYQGNQRTAKLRSIRASLDSLAISRPATVRDQRLRLERVRTEIINVVKKECGVSCCCRIITTAMGNDPDKFEAEMKRPCPVHGRRSLGYIMLYRCTIEPQSDLRLLKLVRQYYQSQVELASGSDLKTTEV